MTYDHKSEIIFTFHKSDKEAFTDIHDQLAHQLASYKGIEFAPPVRDVDTLQFGVYFDYDSKIPTICIEKTQINDYITMNIFENSFISLLLIKDNILKQFEPITEDTFQNLNFLLNKENNVLSICFRNVVPSFKLYDKGDKS